MAIIIRLTRWKRFKRWAAAPFLRFRQWRIERRIMARYVIAKRKHGVKP